MLEQSNDEVRCLNSQKDTISTVYFFHCLSVFETNDIILNLTEFILLGYDVMPVLYSIINALITFYNRWKNNFQNLKPVNQCNFTN